VFENGCRFVIQGKSANESDSMCINFFAMKIKVAHKDECDDMMTDGEVPKKKKSG
jgi:hypothetical protein